MYRKDARIVKLNINIPKHTIISSGNKTVDSFIFFPDDLSPNFFHHEHVLPSYKSKVVLLKRKMFAQERYKTASLSEGEPINPFR